MTRLLKSFGFAFRGIRQVFQSEQNMKIHLVAAILALMLAFALHVAIYEWIAIVFCITLVFSTEIMNTAIEKLTDRVSDEYHPLSKIAKDAAAGAVLVSAIGSVVVAGLIFIPKVLVFLSY